MATAAQVQVSYKDSSEDEDNVSDTTDEDNHESDASHSSAEGASENETPEEIKVEENEDGADEKTGLADVMAKILNKKAPTNKPVVLAKAMTDKQIAIKRKQKKTEEDETTDKVKKSYGSDSSDDEYDPNLTKEQRLKRKAWEELGRVKVDITQREKERRLQKICTKGVVHLFNAVRTQQKELEERLNEVGTEGKREKVIQSLSKRAFLDMIKTTPNVSDEPVEPKVKKLKKTKVKEEVDSDESDEGIDGEKPSWSILRDDFMMGATMKDWDKEDEDEEDESDEMEESDEDES